MPFDSLNFRHSWRPYQQRVLDAIHEHLDDKRLHVVAAPGAGKTTLGLEVFKQLKKSALVLSPTRVIRDQWISRLADFSEAPDVTQLEWVSNSIHSPKILTSVTYQSIHHQLSETLKATSAVDSVEDANTLGTGIEEQDEAEIAELEEPVTEDELDGFIALLKKHNIGVIILDEAHHLRAEWWRALDKVCAELPDIILVSLTATPPYDSQDSEWRRYEELCGPIDEEISIPELVKAGTLCPHQDYIWAVDASTTEKQKVAEYDQRVSNLCHTLATDSTFEGIVLAHPWISTEFSETDIIKFPQIAISLLAFIKHKQLPLPQGLLKTLDLKEVDIPELGRHWWQVLVEAVLFSTTFNHSEEHKDYISQLKKQLRATELLHKRELSLERSRRVERSLSQSASKVDGCVELHQLEYKQRAESLRQVILVDYIRDEALRSGMQLGELTLGACPIFGRLIESSPIADRVALITGRLSLIHRSLSAQFLSHVEQDRFKLEPIEQNPTYLKVIGPLNQQTHAFTQLLIQGDVVTLIGTRSLLGEGWDAPVINSLIMASTVGSYMLTNQMRGRAIRIDRSNPNKASSIWHLVAVDEKSQYAGWSDYYDLRQRFNTFVGLSEKKETIESGFERLNCRAFDDLLTARLESRIKVNNRVMRSRYNNVGQLAVRWNAALTLDESARVIPSVKTPQVPQIRAYHIKNTLKYILLEVLGSIMTGVLVVLQLRILNLSAVLTLLSLCIVGGMLYQLPKTISAVKILLKHLPVDGSIKQIGIALAEALCRAGFIKTSFRRMKVNVIEGGDGTLFVALSGCTFYESSLFSDCMAEILAPIESPRYLVIREGKIYGMQRDDYHAVPMKLATKKNLAEIFYVAWAKYVGPSELVYTRNEEGRARLVKARMQAFSSTYAREVKRQDRWQ